MKSILFVVILVIIFKRTHDYIYVKGLKNNWIRYILFSFISSVVITILKYYVNENRGNIEDSIISAIVIGIITFAAFILYPIVRDKINALSNDKRE